MKIYVSRLYFIPRIPLPVISDDPFYHEGEYLFFFENIPRVFVDFQVDEKYRVHVTDPVLVIMSDNDVQVLKTAFEKSINALSYRVSFQQYKQYDCFFLPLMVGKDKSGLQATLEWANSFLKAPKGKSTVADCVFS